MPGLQLPPDLMPKEQDLVEEGLRLPPDGYNPNGSEQLRHSLFTANGREPESFARAVRLAEESGLPSSVVEGNEERVEERLKPKVDADALEKNSPATALVLQDPDTAALAQDDVAGMEYLETLFKPKEKPGLIERHVDAVEKSFKGLKLGVTALTRYSETGYFALDAPMTGVQATAEAARTGPRDWKEERSKEIVRLSEEFTDLGSDPLMMEFSELVETTKEKEGQAAGIAAGVIFALKNPSIGTVLLAEQTAPLLLAGPAGGFAGAAMKPIFNTIKNEAIRKYAIAHGTLTAVNYTTNLVGTYGPEISEGISQGKTAEEAISRAAIKAQTEAAVNASGGLLPFVGGPIAKVLTETAKQGVFGGLGAYAAAKAVGEDAPLSELMLEVLAEATTAPVDLAFAGVEVRAQKQAEIDQKAKAVDLGPDIQQELNQVVDSNQSQMGLDEIIASAKTNKLGERSSEKFQTFSQAVVEHYGSESIYLDADNPEVRAILDSFTPTESIVEEINRQYDQGGSIVIPMDDYLSDLARNDMGDALRPYIAIGPEAMTMADLDEAQPGIQQRTEEMLSRAIETTDDEQALSRITETVFDQLIESGQMRPRMARANAAVFTARVQSAAEEYGLTVGEVEQRLGFGGVKGEYTDADLMTAAKDAGYKGEDLTEAGEFLNTANEANVLEQGKADGYEGDNVGEAKEWTDALAKFGPEGMTKEARMARAKEQGYDVDTVYYHGSSRGGYNDTHDIQAFDFEKTGDKWGQDKDAFFFSDSAGEANYYATTDNLGLPVEGSVYPTYQRSKNPLVIDSKDDLDLAGEQAIGYWDARHEELIERAKSGGHDAIQLVDRGAYEDSKDVMYVALDPANIRSIHAAFDPKKQDSPNLLAQAPQKESAAQTAHDNAMLPIEEGGLGLPEGNIAKDRAKALGFKPKKWYHWSPNKFDAFDTDRGDLGAHFGTIQQAEYRANVFDGDPADVNPFLIKGSNFLRLKDVGTFHADGIALQLEKKGLLEKGEGRRIEKEVDENWKLRKKYDPYIKQIIQDAGYDGVIYKNTHEGSGDSVVILDPANIRSTDALFDPKEQDSPVFLSQEGAANEKVRALFDKTDRTITLLKDADPSSFVHEMGHLFLEFEAQLSEEFGITERQTDLLKWLGVESFSDIETKHHEQFARGFEAYMMEGKAPSLELASVFASFRSWLLTVYKRISKLDVTLTPEVRNYFDHLLASETQIERAQANAAYDQFFESPEAAGKTPEEYQEYLDRRKKSRDRATQTLDQKVLARLRQHYEKEWTEEEAALKADIREELLEQDVYRVVAFLRGEINLDGKKGKLTRSQVDEILHLTDPKSDPSTVNKEVDSLLVAVAKLGGLDRDDAQREGVDPDNWKGKNSTSINQPVFGKRIFKIDGRSFDYMRESLYEYGYEYESVPDFLDAVQTELNVEPVYSLAADLDLIFGVEEGEPAKTPFPRKLWGMTKKDGLDVEMVAKDFGFGSGHSMLTQIVAAPERHDLAAVLANEQMIRRHGDILNDGTIEQEAREASQNEDQAKALLDEIKTLGKLSGTPTGIDRQYLKVQAAATVAKMRVNDVKPDRFYRAEIKAAERAAVARDAGDIEGALNYKVQQLSNHYLFRAATEAKVKIDKRMSYIKKAQTAKISSKLVNPEYINQRAVLANLYDFKSKNKEEARSKLTAIASWLSQQIAKDEWIQPQFFDPVLSDISAINDSVDFTPEEKTQLISQLEIPSYKEMTFEQIDGVYEMLVNLRYVGGRLSQREADAFTSMVEEVAENIEKHGGKSKPFPIDPNKAQQVRATLAQFTADHVAMGNYVTEMDGFEFFGPMFNAFYQGIIDSGNYELTLKKSTIEELQSIFGEYKGRELGSPLIDPMAHGKVEIVQESGERLTMDLRERMMLGLYWGTPGSRESILNGRRRPMTESDVQQFLNTLTGKDLDFIEKVWAMNEKLWPLTRETALKMTGVSPPKQEHSSFVVNGREMKGGYIRMYYAYDVKDSTLGTVKDEAKLTRSGGHVMKNTKHGARKEKVGSGGRTVSLNLNNLFRALDENIHDIAYAETIRDSYRFLEAGAVSNAIVDKYGKGAYESLLASLDGIASGPQAATSLAPKISQHTRHALSVGVLGYSPRNIVQQPIAFANVAAEIGEDWAAKGLAPFLGAPLEINSLIKKIREMSPFMDNRSALVNRETAAIQNKLDSNVFSSKYKEHAFSGQTMADMTIAFPAFWGGYLKAIDEGRTEKQAIDYAGEVVSRTIGSGMPKDLAPILQGTGHLRVGGLETMKNITIFGTFFNKTFNLVRNTAKQTDWKSPKGFTRGAINMAWLLPIQGMLGAAIVADLPGDDEEWWAWMLASSANFTLATMFLLRDVAYFYNGFSASTPYTRALTQTGRGINVAKDIVVGEKEFNLTNYAKMLRSISAFVPIPGAYALSRIFEGMVEQEQKGNRNPYTIAVEGKDKND